MIFWSVAELLDDGAAPLGEEARAAHTALREERFQDALHLSARGAEVGHDALQQSAMLSISGTALLGMGLPNFATRHFRRGFSVADRAGLIDHQRTHLANLGACTRNVGCNNASLRLLDAALKDVDAERHTTLTRYVALHRALTSLRLGRSTARGWFAPGQKQTAEGVSADLDALCTTPLACRADFTQTLKLATAVARLSALDIDEASRRMNECRQDTGVTVLFSAYAQAWFGRLLLLIGDTTSASHHFLESERRFSALSCVIQITEVYRLMSEVKHEMGDAEGAFRYLRSSIRIDSNVMDEIDHALIEWSCNPWLPAPTNAPVVAEDWDSPRFEYARLVAFVQSARVPVVS